MGRRESKKVPEGQLLLFHKPEQPRLNTPEEVRAMLERTLGSSIDPSIIARAAQLQALRDIVSEDPDSQRAARLRAILNPERSD